MGGKVQRFGLLGFGLVLLSSLVIFLAQIAVLAVDIINGLGAAPLQALAGSMGVQILVLLATPILLFVFANSFLAAVACFVAGELHELSSGRYRPIVFALGVLLALWATVLWENFRLFPNSALAPDVVLPSALRFISLWYGWLLLFAVLAFLRCKRGQFDWRTGLLFVPVLLVACANLQQSSAQHADTSHGKPNVILIGIDSLRTDVVAGIGAKSDLVPHMSHWLKQGAVFPLTYTPVARTYPSWMGILSGRYPIHSGARVNLMSPTGLDLHSLLPVLMRENGYKTVYAIDEKRFSNIDESYGFDVTLGPSLGASDFLASMYDDLPLSNVLATSIFGPYLMPAQYANRGLPLTYRPDDFQQQLRHSLARPSEKPLFMAVHFCLPHWPYVWGQVERRADIPDSQSSYVSAVRRADGQLGALMSDLQKNGYLENALVIFLSDHGEALGFDSDAPYAPYNPLGGAPVHMFGHGYDLLSPIQNQVVLGFVGFGAMAQKTPVGSHPGTAMLLDIVPTITDMAGVKLPWSVDGRSLAAVIAGNESLEERPIFMETEFDLLGMANSMPNTARLLLAGAHLYRITPDGRVELKPDAFDDIVRSKKRGVVYQGHILQITPRDIGAKLEFVNQASRKLILPTLDECKRLEQCATLLSLLHEEYGKEFEDIRFSAVTAPSTAAKKH